MSRFLNPLIIKEISDSIFQVVKPFTYQSDLLKRIVTVPAGFQTDFASVPRLGILYAALGDRAHEPAVIHDFLYAAGITDRKSADRVLLEAMRTEHIPFWQAYAIYWGVRIGGWYAWNQHRKQGNFKG